MPRAIWTGSISFGLVNVPVRMYSAIDEKDLHFSFVHEPDGSRIGYQKVCKEEERPVPDDEIVKAFEIEKGEWVYMTDEDIDPIYFERTYYLGPQENGEKIYALLVRTLEDSGLAAIAKYVMRDKQHLGCLRVRDGVVTLEKMFFADEIRPLDEIKPARVKVDGRELELAAKLVESYSGAFEPEKYDDTYRDALCEVIRAKRKGKKPPKPAPAGERPADLMAALRASLESTQGRRSASNGSSGNGGLAEKSKDELYELAKKADVKGRADMSKDELVEALHKG